MERGSDRHSPRADEIKKHTQGLEKGEPLESRIEEFRKDEEIEPDPPQDEPERKDSERGDGDPGQQPDVAS